jgi:hypothetical protein
MKEYLGQMVQNKIEELSQGIEENLTKLSYDTDNKDNAWVVKVFYKFEFSERYELSDECLIKVTYQPVEDEIETYGQFRHAFKCTSRQTIFLNKICLAIFNYVTKNYLEEGFPNWSSPGKELSFEVITDIFEVSLDLVE